MYDIGFPHLGIYIENLKNSVQITENFSIAYYGIIIALGIIVGLFIIWKEAERKGEDSDLYTDFIFYAVIGGVICARLYYVIFMWDYYKANPGEIINIRNGGLAIYGAVIGGLTALYIFSRIKKKSFFDMADRIMPSLILAQAMGRWGNFFNMEAFGGYTDNLFAMQLRLAKVNTNMLSGNVLEHIINVNGTEYIQVHPTFLYESAWNLLVFIVLMIWRKKEDKPVGEIFWMYVGGYGLGRVIIEGMRTDSLMLGPVRISQLVAGVCVVFAAVMIALGRKKLRTGKTESDGTETRAETETGKAAETETEAEKETGTEKQ